MSSCTIPKIDWKVALGDRPPSVPLQPVVGSPYFATPRTDMAHIVAGMDYAQDAYDDAWSHARGLERDLNEALCAIRQLLNDGMQVQNLNNGEVDVFRADVDGIVEFLEATFAKAMLARRTSNPAVRVRESASVPCTGVVRPKIQKKTDNGK